MTHRHTVSGPRLAVLLPSLSAGGVGRSMLRLSGALASDGVRVQVLVVDRSGPYLGEIPRNVDLIDLRAGRVLTALRPIVRHLRRTRPDAVLSAITHLNVATVLAARTAHTGARVVLSERTTVSHAARHSELAIDRVIARVMPFVYRGADAVVAVSHGVADHLEDLGVDPHRLHVIHNPALIDDIHERASEPVDDPWLAEDRPIIVSAGRMVTQKDFPTLLTAFAKLRRSVPARLLLLGEGPQRATLEEHAAHLGLSEDELHMPGFVPNPYPYFRAADVFVLSSVYEGFGNVLVEALSLGTQVVSTDCESGPAEILANGRYGRLVPMRDPDALAAAVEQTLDEGTVPELGDWLDRFSLPRVASEYRDVLFGSPTADERQ